jgi:hypothetical protein
MRRAKAISSILESLLDLLKNLLFIVPPFYRTLLIAAAVKAGELFFD